MSAMRCVLVCVLFVTLACAVPLDSPNTVYRLNVRSQDQLQALLSFADSHVNVDWWTSPRIGPVDVRLHNSMVQSLPQGIEQEVLIEDIQEKIRNEASAINIAAVNNDKPFAETYHTHEQIEAWMTDLANTTSFVRKFEVGKTYEKRTIHGIAITGTKGEKKRPWVLHGGIHAREWISVATMIHLAEALINGYNTDDNITNMLDFYEVLIIPVLNVDGYIYTWTNERMWRRNRQPTPLPTCIGTDLNRNFPFHFGEKGASTVPCSDSYHGPSKASAPETKALLEFIGKVKPDVYIDTHAYSQLWMFPYGYSCSNPIKEAEVMQKAVDIAVDALYQVHSTNFVGGDICNTIYPASGSTVDTFYHDYNVTYSFAVELRDTGRHGFLLPQDQIKPSGEEFTAAILAMGKFISDTIDGRQDTPELFHDASSAHRQHL